MFLKLAIPLLTGALATASACLQAQDLKSAWAPQLTDCSAFFGVWGQSDSSAADTYKSMSTVFTVYANLVHGPLDTEAELMKSRRKIATLLHQARKGEAASKEEVSKQVKLCLTTLKKAEQELWPRLSAAQKQETPKLSK